MSFKMFVLFFVSVIISQYIVCVPESEESSPIELNSWLTIIDEELSYFNHQSATIAWDMAVGRMNYSDVGIKMGVMKTLWINSICDSEIQTGKKSAKRMIYLLCRGPRYTKELAVDVSVLSERLYNTYTFTKVCVDKYTWLKADLNNPNAICMKGEPDLELLMRKPNLTPDQYLWIWQAWHNTVGPGIKEFYPELVTLMNQGAVKNGYEDIGVTWREELEIESLENFCRFMYDQIQPLYMMLHAVVRHKLVQKYGEKIVKPRGLIPAHLLGNMWAQDWSSLMYLFYPTSKFNLNAKLAKKEWTPKEMVEMAEDFYVSLGLPKMTKRFWEYSKIERTNSSLCHGSAANMFDKNDFRILLCAQLNMEDFYVIHHEMGHIQYYMAYSELPAIFQDGANSAFHESIGDAIMTAVMVPQHLHRLGLITDDQLFNGTAEFDEMLMLQQALAKIPQIPYALMLDLYRWDIFKGKIKPSSYNEAFWIMNGVLRGIEQPEPRGKNYFDAGAKFHVADNTPYIRYFLSAFIQADIFKSLCQWTVYGKVTNDSLPFPLHRCDIYGSRLAGKELKKFMSRGASQHWVKSYKPLTGRKYISYNSIMEYYKPLYEWLTKYIAKYNIPVGW